MKLTSVQLISLMITLLITILPGVYAGRKVNSSEEYTLGGRKSGVGMVAGSIIGTIVGGAATIGTAQMGFQIGLSAWWFTLGSGIGFIIMGLFYAKPLRESNVTTIAEFLVTKFGSKAGPIASISATVGIFFSIVASVLTALHLIIGLLNIEVINTAILIVTIVLALVFFGGINSSGISGILKMILIFATIFVGGIFSYIDLGAINGIRATFPEQPWLSLFGAGISASLLSLGAMIVGIISTQTYAQALFSARDTRTAVAGCFSAALIVIPVGLPSVLIGMYMKVMHPDINSIEALPLYMCLYLPQWLGGVGIAALLLSSLGSISGLALGIGTMVAKDIFCDLFGIKKSKLLLAVARSSVLIVTVLAVIFVFHHLDSLVLTWNYLSMALRGSAIFIPLTFAIFCKNNIDQQIGVVSMFVGVSTACVWPLISNTDMNALFPSLAASLSILLVGVFWRCLKQS